MSCAVPKLVIRRKTYVHNETQMENIIIYITLRDELCKVMRCDLDCQDIPII